MKASKVFWHSWIRNYSMSEVLAVGACGVIVRILFFAYSKTPWADSQWMNLLVLVVSGLFEGTLVALVEWRAISKLVSSIKFNHYLVATILPSVFGWIFIVPPGVMIVFFVSFFSRPQYVSILFAALTGLTFGGLVSFAQWILLKKYFPNAILWVLANAIAWGISFSMVYFSTSILNGSFWNIIIVILACGVSGLLQGITTGTALHYFMTPAEEGAGAR